MKADVRIDNTIHHVAQHIISDIKRLVAPYSEFKKPAAEEDTESSKKLDASRGKLKTANKKINALEKELAEMKKAAAGSPGGGAGGGE